jgi:hypothetical protein
VPTTAVHTYRVPVREGKDGTEYTLERTFRSLVPRTREGGPYLTQQGDVFFVDEVSEDGELVGRWHWGSGR